MIPHLIKISRMNFLYLSKLKNVIINHSENFYISYGSKGSISYVWESVLAQNKLFCNNYLYKRTQACMAQLKPHFLFPYFLSPWVITTFFQLGNQELIWLLNSCPPFFFVCSHTLIDSVVFTYNLSYCFA